MRVWVCVCVHSSTVCIVFCSWIWRKVVIVGVNVEWTSWERMMCWSVSPTNSLESGLEDRPEGDRHFQAAFLKSTDSSHWAHGWLKQDESQASLTSFRVCLSAAFTVTKGADTVLSLAFPLRGFPEQQNLTVQHTTRVDIIILEERPSSTQKLSLCRN